MKTITEQEALNRMAAFCSTAEHCRAEISEKLKKMELDSDASERILSILESEKYIDEERYSRAFVNDKFRFAKWGKVKIAQALYAKKVSSSATQRALDDIDKEEYLAILRKLLAAKQKSTTGRNTYERNAKLIRHALSRGFEMKDIRRYINRPEEMDTFE